MHCKFANYLAKAGHDTQYDCVAGGVYHREKELKAKLCNLSLIECVSISSIDL